MLGLEYRRCGPGVTAGLFVRATSPPWLAELSWHVGLLVIKIARAKNRLSLGGLK